MLVRLLKVCSAVFFAAPALCVSLSLENPTPTVYELPWGVTFKKAPWKSCPPKAPACATPVDLCSPCRKVHPMVDVKSGYFFFSDSKMRKIYDEGGWDIQISGTAPIWKCLQLYGSVEYFKRHGRALSTHEKTSIWEIPLSLGLKAVAPIGNKVQYYAAVGPRYIFLHQDNYSQLVDRSINDNGLGGFVNTGFHFFPVRHWLIDIFGEYSFKRMHVHTHKHNVYAQTIQVGGFAFGLGTGFGF